MIGYNFDWHAKLNEPQAPTDTKLSRMVTRGALARANKIAHNHDDSDSDDEAPEVVSKVTAKEQAEEQLRQEKEAAKARAAATKRSNKRKAPAPEVEKVEEGAEVDGGENGADEDEVDAPELPADVLSAIATRDEEEQAEQELDAEIEKKKHAAAAKKRTHIRDFGTVQVQTLDALGAAESRKLTESAMAFLERKSAPHRNRMNVLDGHPSQFTKKQRRRV